MKKKNRKHNIFFRNSRGFSVVEVMLGTALFAVFSSGVVALLLQGLDMDRLAEEEAIASQYASEGIEALRSVKNQSFVSLAPTAGSGIDRVGAGGIWALSGASTSFGKYVRTVAIENVSRDGSGNIVASGGTPDSMSRKVTSTVVWPFTSSRINTISFTSYLTDWGRPNSSGNWANSIQVAGIDMAGTTNGTKIQVQENFAFLIRPGATPNFLAIDVSEPESPVQVGSLALPGTPTNIAVSGTLAVVSNTHNRQELQIITIANPSSVSVVGVFNASGNENALGVFLDETTAYVSRTGGASNEFLIVNVSTPSDPTLVGSLNLGGSGTNGNEVIVSGNVAYVASSSNTQEVQTVNMATPSSPVLVGSGSLNLPGNTDARTIAISGTTLLVGQGNILHTVNIATPVSPSILGSINVSDALNDIALNSGSSNTLVFLATSANAAEFQVADISVLATPVILGSVNVATNNNLLGIAYSETLDRAFGASASDTEEIVVFSPQ